MTSIRKRKLYEGDVRQFIADAYDVPLRLLGYSRVLSARRRRVESQMRRVARRAARRRGR